MRFFRESIIRKLFLKLFLFVFLVAVLGFYFYSGAGSVPFYFFLVSLGIFLLYFLIIYWVDIVKPFKIVLYEMQALISGKPYKRIFTTRIDEIGIIAQFFNQVTKGLGEISNDIKDRRRMVSELDVAAELQRDILPLTSPVVRGLQIVAKNKPASELGGDSFNYFTHKNKTYIYIGDVTGHGVAAGLIMTMANSLISVFSEICDNAYDIIVEVNSHIKQHVKKAMFMTMTMLCWDDKSEKMTYVGAGHEHILVYRAGSGECEAILAGGVALGMVPDNSKLIKEQEIELEDDDTVVLYSDGITEARNAKGELYGLDRLKEALIEYAPQYSAEGINYHVARNVAEFSQGHPQSDDMTLIVIKRDASLKAEKIKDQTTNWKA